MTQFFFEDAENDGFLPCLTQRHLGFGPVCTADDHHIAAETDCHTCRDRPICSGGCYHEAHVRYGDSSRPNLHYLGGRKYEELPFYLGSWDVALMPFAINESTKFISPTKTPEYLAGGKPVVSTPITDVVRHYGDLEGVRIASTADEFIAECETALKLGAERGPWLEAVDRMLAELSWDSTQGQMAEIIE